MSWESACIYLNLLKIFFITFIIMIILFGLVRSNYMGDIFLFNLIMLFIPFQRNYTCGGFFATDNEQKSCNSSWLEGNHKKCILISSFKCFQNAWTKIVNIVNNLINYPLIYEFFCCILLVTSLYPIKCDILNVINCITFSELLWGNNTLIL